MKQALHDIGFTEGETEVYLTLLQLGPSTNTPIAKHSGLQSSSVYYCLNRLLEKGVISYVQKGGRKVFQASDPVRLLAHVNHNITLLKESREDIEQLVPKFTALREKSTPTMDAEVYEGFNGLRLCLRTVLETLPPGSVYEAFTIKQVEDEPDEIREFFIHLNNELKRRKITVRLLAPERLRKVFTKFYGKRFLNKMSDFRYTEKPILEGVSVYGDVVLTTVMGERPLTYFLRNKEVAEMYRALFYSHWDEAKP